MNFDPELMQDFLTESGELLEQLDQDLVTLESAPEDLELLNRVFRALHTIKGSASFLALTNLVAIAHAAETCLNAARNRAFVVDRPAMDQLLAAVDIIKRQFDDIRAGQDLSAADPALVESLTARGEGRAPAAAAAPAHAHAAAPSAAPASAPAAPAPAAPAAPPPPASVAAGAAASTSPGTPSERPLELGPGKAELLEFLVADLDQSLDQIDAAVHKLADDAQRDAAAPELAALGETLGRSVDFFDFAPMTRLVSLLRSLGEQAAALPAASVGAVVRGAEQALVLLREQSKGLADKKLIERDIEGFCAQFLAALQGAPSAPDISAAASPAAPSSLPPGANSAASEPAESAPPAKGDPAHPAGGEGGEHGKGPAAGDQTIRVEVGRLESLLNLVGELVLQKNRVAALSRQLVALPGVKQELREAVVATSGALDRVTSDLQVAVMRTRMQPLDKLFGKYPRLIRDLARKLNKQIALVIEGGDTEVDKSVIEELGDPLIHLMRNSADHGIESPERRREAGKPELGTITLSASNTGGHVEILIKDDGKGLQRDFIARKAVEKGLYTAEQVAAMSDREVYRIIFAAGFSTAEKLSDVSGRGVGMDVVRANIEKLKGTIELFSQPGQGCTIQVRIPLTVAIMSAMMVGVGDEVYAVPLANITEIVKPVSAQLSTINGSRVMRLRDGVLPLLDAAALFDQPAQRRQEASFAVVVAEAERRTGLLVSRLIGQQEIVIKPLDEFLDRGGPVSGATVRDDGGVSLIVDVARLLQIAEDRRKAAANA